MSTAPCRGCGVAAPGPTAEYPHVVPRWGPRTLATCEACRSLDLDRPGGGVRAALRLLGRDEADHVLAAAVFAEAGADVTHVLFQNGLGGGGLADELPNARPWAHVDRDTLDALRSAYPRVLAERVRRAADTAGRVGPTGPPSGAACMACGVARSAGWGTVHTNTLTEGPGYVDAHLCAACCDALRRVGALGRGFLECAVMTAKGLPWDETTRVPGLRPWGATGREPGEPWQWVEVTAAPPDLDPLLALRLQVADLAAEVEALRGAP